MKPKKRWPHQDDRLEGRETETVDAERLAGVMGAGEFHLEDWFVPVLYQDRQDLPLVTQRLSEQAQRQQAKQNQARLGELPEAPPHTFIRAAFVSLEEYSDARGALDSIGRQLVGKSYTAATYGTSEAGTKEALQPALRELESQATIIVVDNVESALVRSPGFSRNGPDDQPLPPEGRTTNAGAIFALCQKLLAAHPATRIVFTSREPLPAPFDHRHRRIELGALDHAEAIDLVCQVMKREGLEPKHDERGYLPDHVNELVEAANRHARALSLLACEIARSGVTGQRATWKCSSITTAVWRCAGALRRGQAAQVREWAIESYLAYRRDGGYSQSPLAELYAMTAQALQSQQTAELAEELAQLAAQLPERWQQAVIAKLQAILRGDRDPALADDPELDYDDAVELRLLLELL